MHLYLTTYLRILGSRLSAYTRDRSSEGYLKMLVQPFEGVWRDFVSKVFVTLWAVFLQFIGSVRIEEAVLLAICIIIDLCTGIIADKRRGGKLSSKKLRKTVIKVIEYALFLYVISAAATVYPSLVSVQHYSAMFLTVVEIISIVQNSTSIGLVKIVKSLARIIGRKLDSIVRDAGGGEVDSSEVILEIIEEGKSKNKIKINKVETTKTNNEDEEHRQSGSTD